MFFLSFICFLCVLPWLCGCVGLMCVCLVCDLLCEVAWLCFFMCSACLVCVCECVWAFCLMHCVMYGVVV